MDKVLGDDDQGANDNHQACSDAEPNSSCTHKSDGRNLIVCIDGTSNQFGAKVFLCCYFLTIAYQHLQNTNVIELYNLILKEEGDNQLCWYNSGIGTYARSSWKSLKYYKQVLYHKIDLAIAWCVQRYFVLVFF